LIARFFAALLISTAIATSLAAPAAPANTPAPRPAPIDRNGVLVLIRTTLVALQQANQTNNYSVLYGMSAPGFQQTNSPEALSKIFTNLRAKAFDLSGVVVLEPQLTVLPELYENGVMRMAGFFPSVPMQVSFDLQFMAVRGQWRLLAISVDVGSAATLAPTAAVTPTPAVTPTLAPSPSPDIQRAIPAHTPEASAAPKVDLPRWSKPKP
jgi:hypothetical protein